MTEHYGMLWDVIERYGMLWDVTEHHRMLWDVMGCYGMWLVVIVPT